MIKYVGVDDLNIDLFESQYVVKNGMSYNSYIIQVLVFKEGSWLRGTCIIRFGEKYRHEVKIHFGWRYVMLLLFQMSAYFPCQRFQRFI